MPRTKGITHTYTRKADLTKESLMQQGYKKYQRYKYFCVYTKYNEKGEPLYHESFSWFELGKIIKPDDSLTYQKRRKDVGKKHKWHKPHSCKMHKGGIQ